MGGHGQRDNKRRATAVAGAAMAETALGQRDLGRQGRGGAATAGVDAIAQERVAVVAASRVADMDG